MTSKRLLIIAAATFLAATAALFADTPASGFRIDTITYNIDGRTREWALDDILDLQEGAIFASEVELEEFLLRQRQILVNQRVLQDVAVEWVISDSPSEDNTRDVAVTVSVRDTWNFIILPYFKYDSNSGLLLSLRTRDYNFFGTMQELEIDFDYERTEDDTDLFTIASQFRLPFNLLEQRWELIFTESFETDGEDFDFDISAGLGYRFDWLGLDWEAIYTESYRYLTDDPEEDFSYFTSEVELGSTVDTGVALPLYGTVEYRPGVYVERNHRPGGISRNRSGITAGFEHALGAGDYDWFGNYRRGSTIEISNDNAYNIVRERWNREVAFLTAVYQPLMPENPENPPKAGVSAAFSGFYLIDGADEDQEDAAAAARGLLDNTMNGDLGLFLNLDAVFTLWTLRPLFEAQVGAFFDVAYVRDLRGDFYTDKSFESKRDLRYGTGIEVVGFPLFARSLYIRASLGVDLYAVQDGAAPLSSEARELFIGLGHHY